MYPSGITSVHKRTRNYVETITKSERANLKRLGNLLRNTQVIAKHKQITLEFPLNEHTYILIYVLYSRLQLVSCTIMCCAYFVVQVWQAGSQVGLW